MTNDLGMRLKALGIKLFSFGMIFPIGFYPEYGRAEISSVTESSNAQDPDYQKHELEIPQDFSFPPAIKKKGSSDTKAL